MKKIFGVMNSFGGEELLEERTIRVLVVNDYEPFRQYVRKTLGKRLDTRVVGEASDGLHAIRQAEELQPDLIVLDIGLPTLNGIEAARRIRELCPNCKILFLTQESSAEVAQEAFDLGAIAYVVKAHAASELPAAAEAVCQGRRFVSKGLVSSAAKIPGSLPSLGRLNHHPGDLN